MEIKTRTRSGSIDTKKDTKNHKTSNLSNLVHHRTNSLDAAPQLFQSSKIKSREDLKQEVLTSWQACPIELINEFILPYVGYDAMNSKEIIQAISTGLNSLKGIPQDLRIEHTHNNLAPKGTISILYSVSKKDSDSTKKGAIAYKISRYISRIKENCTQYYINSIIYMDSPLPPKP